MKLTAILCCMLAAQYRATVAKTTMPPTTTTTDMVTEMVTEMVTKMVTDGGVTRMPIPGLPSGEVLAKIVKGSFDNVDSDNDSLIERYEFDTLVIIADSNDDGCMTLSEYKDFSAGTSAIATKIYKYFDPTDDNCLTVDKVSGQFFLMDADGNGEVTLAEFEKYYLNLLQMLFNPPETTDVSINVG